VPSPTAGGSSWIGPAIKVVVFLAVAVGAFLAWRLLFAGFPFPEEIAGQPRMEGEQAEELSRLVEDIGALADADVKVALYGQGPMPTHMMYVAEFDDPEAIDMGAFVDPGYAAALKRGETACQVEAQGATCSWLDGETTLVGVGGFGLAPEDVSPVAEDVRADLG
jgi:hypothetical protein